MKRHVDEVSRVRSEIDAFKRSPCEGAERFKTATAIRHDVIGIATGTAVLNGASEACRNLLLMHTERMLRDVDAVTQGRKYVLVCSSVITDILVAAWRAGAMGTTWALAETRARALDAKIEEEPLVVQHRLDLETARSAAAEVHLQWQKTLIDLRAAYGAAGFDVEAADQVMAGGIEAFQVRFPARCLVHEVLKVNWDQSSLTEAMAWVMDTAGLDRSVARAFAAGCTLSSVANDAVAPDGNVRHLVRKRPKWRR